MTHARPSTPHLSRLAAGVAGVALLALAACGGGGGATSDLAVGPTAGADGAGRSEPGDFAADFLRSARFDLVRVEVDYPSGRAPAAGAVEWLESRLSSLCAKPGGVEIALDDEIPVASFPAPLDGDDLRDLERAWRDDYADAASRTLSLYVLCVPGPSAQDGPDARVLGLSFGGTSLALFLDATDRGDDLFATTAEMQASILVHETGHLLGLVDGATPAISSHEDPEHPHHCATQGCIMAAAPAVVRAGPSLGDARFAAFCDRCLEDLRANGGR